MTIGSSKGAVIGSYVGAGVGVAVATTVGLDVGGTTTACDASPPPLQAVANTRIPMASVGRSRVRTYR